MRLLPRSLLVGFCAITFLVSAHAIEFSWANRGTITFDLPSSWDVDGRPVAGGGGYAFKLHPKSGIGVLQIMLANTPADRPVEAAKLTATLEAVVRDQVDGSVEKKFAPQPLPLAQGSGVFVHLTDASLVGQPPQPENLKAMRNAVAALDDHALAIITLQFDDAAGPELGAMMEIVRSLRLQRLVLPVKSPASPPRTSAFEFTIPETKLRLRIADGRLVEDLDRAGTTVENPRYFKLSDRTVSRIVSGWFEPAERYAGLQKFWRGESATLTKNGLSPEGVEFAQVGNWEVVFYHQTVSADARMCHLRAELVRAGTWIDLHLSATGPESLAALRDRLKATLASIEVLEK